MRASAAAFAVLALLTHGAPSSPAPAGSPAHKPMPAAVDAAQRTSIDALVAQTMRAAHIAGATVAVSVRGSIAYERAFGFSDLSTRRPAQDDTVYPVGSITKQFTAACILLLAQEGRLSIDDPLSRYVPELPWADRVTLRHLLDQESGIVDFRLGVTDVETPVSERDVLDRLKQTDLYFAPGSRYEYSNSNYYLLGLVIERVSSRSYAAVLHDRVLQPQGLNSTYYNDRGVAIPDVAAGTIAAADGPQPVGAESASWSFAAGALATTAGDLVRWDERLRAGDVLDPSSTQAMFTPGTLDDGSATDYAFGWVVVKHDGHREVWHNGEITGFHAMNAMYPDDRTDVVVLTNTGGTFEADTLAVRIFDVLHPYRPTAADTAAGARAAEWLKRIERGDIDRTQLTDAMSAALPASVVASLQTQLRPLGKLVRVDTLAMDEDASGRSYGFALVFPKTSIHCQMGINGAGKIAALAFRL